MSNWRLNGAGDDPVAFYGEVEPKIKKIAADFLSGAIDQMAADALLGGLFGLRRVERDANAILDKHGWTLKEREDGTRYRVPPSPDMDLAVSGVALLDAYMPPAGDKRIRLYHEGAKDTILAALNEQRRAAA